MTENAPKPPRYKLQKNIKLECQYCKAPFLGVRTDDRYCTKTCKERDFRQENKKFQDQPQSSGVKGVSYNRYNGKWRVKVQGKFYGEFRKIEDAKKVRESLGPIQRKRRKDASPLVLSENIS